MHAAPMAVSSHNMVRQITLTDIYAENCYFYIDDATRHGFIIDP